MPDKFSNQLPTGDIPGNLPDKGISTGMEGAYTGEASDSDVSQGYTKGGNAGGSIPPECGGGVNDYA